MFGTKDAVLSQILEYPIVQLVNQEKDVIVTIRMKNGLVFVTKYQPYEKDLSLTYFLNLDDIQSKLTPTECVKFCQKAVSEGGWKFRFWKEDK